MGKLQTGILGKSTGKVGPVITAGWKGLNVVKQYFKPSNPRTPAQQQNRSRFATLVALARSILYIIVKPIWDKLSDNMSGFNLIVKEFMNTADNSNLLTQETKLSKGPLVGLLNFNATKNSSYLVLTWTVNSGTGNAKENDSLSFIVYDKSKNEFFDYNPNVTYRSAGEYEYEYSSSHNLANCIVYAWLSQTTEQGKIYSDSTGKQITVS